MTYPTKEQYEGWKQEASDRDMTVSKFMQAMIEAGRKKVEAVEIEPDETRKELREDRNQKAQELEQARERIKSLEQKTNTDEQQAILDHLADEGASEYAELVNAVIEGAGERVDRHLDRLVGDEITVEDGLYQLADPEEAE